MKRTLLFTYLFYLFICFIALLVAAEYVLKCRGWGEYRIVKASRENIHPIYHHIISRRAKGWNVIGFRVAPEERNYTTEKEEGVYRIIMLGDSYVYGLGVKDYSETIPYYLEGYLNKNSDKGDYEVFGFAIPSYSPIKHYLTLKNIGLKLKPDMVLCLYDDSDVQDDRIHSRRARYNAEGELIAVSNPGYEKKGVFGTISRSALYKYLNYWFKRIPTEAHYIERRTNRYGHYRDDYKSWERYFNISFNFLNDSFILTKKNHIPFIVFNYPRPIILKKKERFRHWLEQKGFDYTRDYSNNRMLVRELGKFCRKNDIQFYDLGNKILELEEEGYKVEDLYLEKDVHFSTRGNRLIGEEIGRILVESKALE